MAGPHLRLHHGWPLGPQHLHRLEDVHHAFVPHPLQHDAERDEDSGPAHAGAAGGGGTQGHNGPSRAASGRRLVSQASVCLAGKWAGAQGAAHLQWTEMGPSWPNCSLVLCTWPMKSMKPSPDLGTPCSGQSVNWNCRTVRDWPSWNTERPSLATEVGDGQGCFPSPPTSDPVLRHRPTPPPAPLPAGHCPSASDGIVSRRAPGSQPTRPSPPPSTVPIP